VLHIYYTFITEVVQLSHCECRHCLDTFQY